MGTGMQTRWADGWQPFTHLLGDDLVGRGGLVGEQNSGAGCAGVPHVCPGGLKATQAVAILEVGPRCVRPGVR